MREFKTVTASLVASAGKTTTTSLYLCQTFLCTDHIPFYINFNALMRGYS